MCNLDNNVMIKKLHFVWFGGKELPSSVKSCIASWKRHCPDWEIIQWNETNFDCDQFTWVREALTAKKYAFAADFVRLWVLKNEGGAYIDTDVEILKEISPCLTNGFVCGAMIPHIVSENPLYNRISMQTGFLYAEPCHPFVQKAMEMIYDNGNRHFVNEHGEWQMTPIDIELMSVLIDSFGYNQQNETQHLKDDIVVYDSSVFATRKSKTEDSYLIHWFDQSWVENTSLKAKIKRFIKSKLYFIYRKQ